MGKKEIDRVNSILFDLVKEIRERELELQTEVYDIPRGGIMLSLTAKPTDYTETRIIRSRSLNSIKGKLISFFNDEHDEALVTDELYEWGIDIEDTMVIKTEGCIDSGLEALLDASEEGDAVFVGSIADFISSDISSILPVLDDLEEKEVMLISHLEFGCKYDELRDRIKTAKVLYDAMRGNDLYKYR